MLLVLLVLTQLSFINSIFAFNEPSDVQTNLHMDGAQTNILNTDYYAFEPGSALPVSTRTKICNTGTESIESFVLGNNSENVTTTNVNISVSNTTATLDGIFDFPSLTWSGGQLDQNQCVWLSIFGNVEGEIGETMTIRYDLASSTLLGGGVNNETDISDNFDSVTRPIELLSDISFKSALKLQNEGPIEIGDELSYALTIKNEEGASYPGLGFGLYFIIPAETSFNDDVTLDQTADGIVINYCMDAGPANQADDVFAAYQGSLVVCSFDSPNRSFNVGSELKVTFNLTAESGFLSGITKVAGLLFAPAEHDSYFIDNYLETGNDPFSLNSNNVIQLTFDADPLTVTINRCPGFNAVIDSTLGCFNVVFNKPIYAPSFTVDDLSLVNGGTISNMTQVNDTTWKVDVVNLVDRQTATLIMDAASVQDYSAVMNGVEVLGENTIRYEAPGSNSVVEPTTPTPGLENEKIVKASIQTARTATGVLSATGMHMSETITAIWLCGLGLIMAVFSRRKRPFCRY